MMEAVLKSSFKVLSYASALVPIVGGHIIIPPLSHYRGQEKNSSNIWQYDITPAKFQPKMKNFYNALTLGFRDSTPLLCYRRLTYIFVHDNNSHLKGNLVSLVYAGYPVYKHLGAVGFYMTFILGGMAASIPSPLTKKIKELQKKYNMLYLEKELVKPITSIMPGFLRRWFDAWIKNLGRNRATTYLSIDRFSVGSSGALYAIYGCNSYFFVQDSYKLYKSSRSGINIRDACKQLSFLSLLFCVSVLPVLYQLEACYRMYEKLHPEESQRHYDNIGRAAHLQGAAFGFIFAAYVKSLTRYGIIRIK